MSDDERETLERWARRPKSAQSLALRCRRFAERRLEGLCDEPRPGVPRSITDEMAKTTGMSQSAVSRIWRAFGLKPHLSETFELSADPQFVDKVRDIVGLYLNPPDAALQVGRAVADVVVGRPLGEPRAKRQHRASAT